MAKQSLNVKLLDMGQEPVAKNRKTGPPATSDIFIREKFLLPFLAYKEKTRTDAASPQESLSFVYPSLLPRPR